jgi:vitamin B12 transporter
MNPKVSCFVFLCLLPATSKLFGDELSTTDSDQEIDEVKVTASRVANIQPAGTYASLATTLRFDPQTELQSRGLAEGQADVSVRGGVFENTGFAIGATTIIDPQTGHYTAGLPVDPSFLSPPQLKTGIDNAMTGFNSNIATVAYSLPAISGGGNVMLGLGENNLWYSSLRLAKVHTLHSGDDLALAVSAALSEGDGTLPDGDHDFSRYNLHIQHDQGDSQTDILVSYQDKFYAWPGAYTGFAFLAETDHTKTRLIHANHHRTNENGWIEFSAYYRGLEDDYDFDRTTQESGTPGSFEHETRVYAAGFQGSHLSGVIDWRFGGQLTSDKLVYSTDLTEGDFNSRHYAKFSLVPSIEFAQTGNRTISARAGATLDTSNRDSTKTSPQLGLLLHTRNSNHNTYYEFEYASTSQLPGYTALNSRPTGLFGGNPDLGRETARQLSLSIRREAWDWTGSVTLFHRKDNDLVDWTYYTGAPFSRQANPVDLDVSGLEVYFTRQWNSLDLVAGYTYLDKDSDYGENDVDASFYALNFARHRATLALRYPLTTQLELRLDNEYRVQEYNPLRTSDDKVFTASFALAWLPANIRGLALTLTADNLTDNDYQYFPGTPAVGRQLSISAAYSW